MNRPVDPPAGALIPPQGDDTGGPSAAENLYTDDILRDAFADWEIEELVEYEEDITEGTGHKGRSALIGLMARKPA